ncbi:MAG: helix-turn-helix domain-containing protein, partial [bacterium]
MQWVIEHSQHEGTDFFVLLMLANHAGSDHWECWPSVGLLARECRMSERTIRYALRHIEQGGELSFSRAGGPSGTNLYRLLQAQHLQGGQSLQGASLAPGGGNGRHRRGGHRLPPNHKEPSENHQLA